MKLEFSLTLKVHDETAFRQAAYDQAIKDGLSEDEACEYLNPEIYGVESCACMILDPGVIDGASIIEGLAECY